MKDLITFLLTLVFGFFAGVFLGSRVKRYYKSRIEPSIPLPDRDREAADPYDSGGD